MTIRLLHLYLGVLIAPSVLFFTFSGGLQLFSLHEAHGAYRPPAVIEKLGMLHKDQVFALKPRRAPPADAARKAKPPAAAAAPREEKGPALSATALKWFFLLVAASLFTSTVFGVWMALLQPLRRRNVLMLLAAGVLIPLLLLQL